MEVPCVTAGAMRSRMVRAPSPHDTPPTGLPVTPHLLQALTLRGLTLPNRITVAPMCMYSATDGMASDFHLVHLGRYALGGAGLVIVEATAVQPQGRITHGDLGLWHDGQVEPLARIAAFLKQHGSAAGIQLAHAGAGQHGSGPGTATAR